MNGESHVDRTLTGWLAEGPNQMPDHLVEAIVQNVNDTNQRRSPWLPRRETMNRFLFAAGSVAAIALVAVIGIGIVSWGVGLFGPAASLAPTPTLEPTAATGSPEPTPDATLEPTPEGKAFVISEHAAIGSITLRNPWRLWKGRELGGRILHSDYRETGIFVFPGDVWIYGDACHWSTTTPEDPQSTVDEIIAALGRQAPRGASAPGEITIGGYAGRSITLLVPSNVAIEPQRFGLNDWFYGCDDGKFSTLTVDADADSGKPTRVQRSVGQVDEFWVVNVSGVPVLFDLTYLPDTPPNVVEELRAMAESATFGD